MNIRSSLLYYGCQPVVAQFTLTEGIEHQGLSASQA